MWRLSGEPRATDFVPASEYEASTPAAFGLPEVPVLYAHCAATHDGAPAQVWVASDGVYVWTAHGGSIADSDAVQLRGAQLQVESLLLDVGAGTADTIARALDKAAAFNALAGAHEDNVEIAVPLDFESGQADDLGEAQLEHSVGVGLSLASGPAIASKRRRPS